jgi:hypothetical protein
MKQALHHINGAIDHLQQRVRFIPMGDEWQAIQDALTILFRAAERA